MIEFKILGILGLILIIFGTLMLSAEKLKKKNIFILLLFGGIFLLIYSAYINDLIFIILQIAYILVVVYDLIKLKTSKRK